MRIGINAIFLVPGQGGGIERYLRNLIRAFHKIDHKNEYTVFTNRDNTGTFNLRDNFNECLVPVSARIRPIKILWEQTVFPFQVKRADVDILFSPGNISPLFLSCPSVVVIHDLIAFKWPDNFTKAELYPLQALLCLSAKKADKIITVSKSSQRQILDLFSIPSDKTTLVYEACDERFLHYKSCADDKNMMMEKLGINGNFILYTASTSPHKNVRGLLAAFSRLKKTYRIKHLLVIAGPNGSDHDSVVRMAAHLGLGEEVVFTGYVCDTMLPALYSAASVFVYPSFYEGFGLPVLEAMACGSPVVASNAASLPEVVGNAGLLFDPHNVEQMSESIYKVLSDSQCQLDLTARGNQRVKEFSWENTAKEVLDVLCAT